MRTGAVGRRRRSPWRSLDHAQRGVLTSTLAANALIFFDQTAVTVALPAIADDLDASAAEQQWVITAYLLALAVVMPVAGRLADHLGRKRVYVTGLLLFGASSAACAIAPGMGALIAARFAQGVGGAFVQPVALGTTTRAVPGPDRGWAIGLLSTGGTSFLALGPLLAGAVLGVASWRWLFVLTLPVVAVAVVQAWRWIAPSREPAAVPVSILGVLLLLGGLGAAVLGITQLPVWGVAALGPLLLGMGLLVVFVRRNLRSAHPLLPVGLVRDRRLSASLVALVAIQFAVLSVTVYLVLFLQHGLGLSAFAAGLVLAMTGVCTPLLSLATGRAADVRGARHLVLPGLVLATFGLLGTALVAGEQRVVWLLPFLLLFGLSRPSVFTPASVGPLSELPLSARGVASSLVTESRQLGAVLGVVVCGAAWSWFGSGRLDAPAGVLARGFAASTLVAAAVTATAAVIVARRMPAGRAPR